MNTLEPSLWRGVPGHRSSLDGVERSVYDVRQPFLGRSLASLEAYVTEHAPHRGGRGFATSWQTKLFDRFRAELKPMPHLMALLKHLSEKGIAYCIASSGTFERLGVALSALRLSEQFKWIFSAEQVARGKPEPDLFLFAAHEFGVRPEACLVIEASPYGVRAAKTADMRCVGFVGGGHLQGIANQHGEVLRQNGADVIVASFDALFAKHASWGFSNGVSSFAKLRSAECRSCPGFALSTQAASCSAEMVQGNVCTEKRNPPPAATSPV